MQVDPAQHTHAENYKLLTNLVVPRPIAWVSTADERGVVNLAPFSFFNAVCGEPLYSAGWVHPRSIAARLIALMCRASATHSGKMAG